MTAVFILQSPPCDSAQLPDYMKDWGQSFGDDEEEGNLPDGPIEIDYGCREGCRDQQIFFT